MERLKKDVMEYTDSEEERIVLNKEIDTLEGCTQIDLFCYFAYDRDNLHKLWDTGPDIQYDIDPSFRNFWQTAWLPFMEHLKTEPLKESMEAALRG